MLLRRNLLTWRQVETTSVLLLRTLRFGVMVWNYQKGNVKYLCRHSVKLSWRIIIGQLSSGVAHEYKLQEA